MRRVKTVGELAFELLEKMGDEETGRIPVQELVEWLHFNYEDLKACRLDRCDDDGEAQQLLTEVRERAKNLNTDMVAHHSVTHMAIYLLNINSNLLKDEYCHTALGLDIINAFIVSAHVALQYVCNEVKQKGPSLQLLSHFMSLKNKINTMQERHDDLRKELVKKGVIPA